MATAVYYSCVFRRRRHDSRARKTGPNKRTQVCERARVCVRSNERYKRGHEARVRE